LTEKYLDQDRMERIADKISRLEEVDHIRKLGDLAR